MFLFILEEAVCDTPPLMISMQWLGMDVSMFVVPMRSSTSVIFVGRFSLH